MGWQYMYNTNDWIIQNEQSMQYVCYDPRVNTYVGKGRQAWYLTVVRRKNSLARQTSVGCLQQTASNLPAQTTDSKPTIDGDVNPNQISVHVQSILVNHK